MHTLFLFLTDATKRVARDRKRDAISLFSKLIKISPRVGGEGGS